MAENAWRKIEKRDGKWCVVHCHGEDAGKPIACFDTYEEALAMHRAIMANKYAELITQATVDIPIKEDDGRPPKRWWNKCIEAVSDKPDVDDPQALCGWVWYHHMRHKSTSKFSIKSEPLQIATAPVLIPNEPDYYGDIVSEEEVEKASYDFMENFRIIDIDHTLNPIGVPVESWILREPWEDYPKGTWMMSVKIYDPKVWKKIVDGTLKGLSLMAVPKVQKSAETKNALLREMGEFLVLAVSVVDKPAVRSKWVSLKNILGLKEYTEQNNEELKTKEVEEMNEEQIKALVEQLLAPVIERIQKLEELLQTIQGLQTELEKAQKKSAELENQLTELAQKQAEQAKLIIASKQQDAEPRKEIKMSELDRDVFGRKILRR